MTRKTDNPTNTAEPVITDDESAAPDSGIETTVTHQTPQALIDGLFAAKVEERSPEEVSAEILEAILGAETAEDVLAGGAAMHADMYLDTPFFLLDFKEAAGEFGFFALLQVVDFATGEIFRITCGGQFVLAQLVRLRELNALPRVTQLIQRGTRQGYEVLRLIAAELPETIAPEAAKMLKTGEAVPASV